MSSGRILPESKKNPFRGPNLILLTKMAALSQVVASQAPGECDLFMFLLYVLVLLWPRVIHRGLGDTA